MREPRDRGTRVGGKAVALTVSQFGKAERVEVTDESGKVRFRGEASGTETVDIGPPGPRAHGDP